VRIVGLLLAGLALGCGTPQPQGGPRLLLEDGRFRAEGLSGGLLSVVVSGESTPLFGEQRVEGGSLVFLPRYPLRPGVTYVASAEGPAGRLEASFTLPRPPAGPPAELVAVFPSGSKLPENTLKFYLHFSSPMSRGEAYRRVHLMEAGGKEVEVPFLELGEELWDPSGTRFTLFFDPGRIKRGLKPREEDGPCLEEGKSYVFVVDREWKDIEGRPLKEGFQKSFSAGAPDDRQPDPKAWILRTPRAGTRAALEVRLDEPLDAAMLNRVVTVAQAAGGRLQGRVSVSEGETCWTFTPDAPWTAGRHALVVDSVLEDRAGNSVGRPFEVDLFRPIEKESGTTVVSIPFDVAR
jgi:hypothetical protein